MAVPSFDKSERGIVKLRFEDGGQKSSNHFLGHPIANHGNPERAKLCRAGSLGYVDTTQRPWPELSGFHLPHQRREVVLEVCLKHLDANLVHPSGPAIPLYRLEGLSHELGRNPPCQRVHLDLFHGEPFTLCNHGVRTVEPLGDVS